MSTENKKIETEGTESASAVSDEQLETVVGGNNGQGPRRNNAQVSLGDPVADLNGDGDVTLHEVVSYNRDQRDK